MPATTPTRSASAPATSPADPPFGRFFLPGPTEVHPEVLQAQARPMIGHRGPDVRALMGRIQEGLRPVFGTDGPVLVSTSSATGLMEAAVRNGVRRRALSLVNGAFSQRFADIVRACGFEVDVLDVPWGAVHDAGALARRLEEGGHDAVTVVHSETSTGALNPVSELAHAAREAADVAVLVDSVTGAGGAEVRADGWGLDFVLTGSQKALALPPGLSFGAASERMMARSATAPAKGVYFDLVKFRSNLEKLQTPNTPAVSLLYALDRQLARIADAGGMEARIERHRRMAERCWAWVDEAREDTGLDLSVLAPPGHRSPTVTCLRLPRGVRGPDVVAAVARRGFVVGGGYGKLQETTVRVGHMGEHTVEELEALLEALGDALGEVAGR